MRHVVEIARQDLRNLRRVPLVVGLLVGLAVLPALYAWFNIGAAWDPYANTGEVSVAVVNADAGTTVDGEPVRLGDDLEDELRENDELDWRFTDERTAREGVEHGDLYASIHVPPSFSADLTSIVDGEARQAEVTYRVNEKVNAVAPTITETGATTVTQRVGDEVVAETTQALSDELDRLGVRVEEQLPSARRASRALSDLEGALPRLRTAGDLLIAADEQWGTIERQADRLLALEEAIPTVRAGGDAILALEARLPEAERLVDDLAALHDSADELRAALSAVAGEDAELGAAADAVEAARDATAAGHDRLDEADAALSALEARLDRADDALEDATVAVEDAHDALDPRLSALVAELEDAADRLAALADDLDASVADLDPDELAALVDHADEALADAEEQLTLLEDALERWEPEDEEDEAAKEALKAALDAATAAVAEAREALDELHESLSEGEIPGEEAAERLVTALEEASAALGESAEVVDAKAQALRDGLARHAMGALTRAEDGLAALEAHVEEVAALLEDGREATAAADDALDDLDAAIDEAADRVDALADEALARADDAVDALAATEEVAEDELPAVAERVEDAADTVRHDLPALEDDYRRAAALLTTHLPTAERAVGELAALAREDLPTLERGVEEAADWAEEVEEEERLAELVEVLRADVDEEAEVLAEPAVLDEEPLFPIPNYGSAMMPFYTTLSLWVGALLLSNLLRTEPVGPDRRPHHTLRQVYLGRGVLFLGMGAAQGLVVSVGNLALLGAHAQHPLLLVAWSALIGLVFMTIVYTLVSVLGNLGKALAIVLLVLQLSGGGGTFPIEVTPPFFQAIHPYLPFTYAIDLLREAVGGVVPSVVTSHLAVLLAFAAAAVVIGMLAKPLLAERIAETSERSRESRLVE